MSDMDVREAANMLQTWESTVEMLCAMGELDAHIVGEDDPDGYWLIDRDSVVRIANLWEALDY